jgi:hypothetical protein
MASQGCVFLCRPARRVEALQISASFNKQLRDTEGTIHARNE